MATDKTNPLVWGAVTGGLSALIVALAIGLNVQMEPNPLIANPLSAGLVGFVFGWAAGNFRLWLGRRQ